MSKLSREERIEIKFQEHMEQEHLKRLIQNKNIGTDGPALAYKPTQQERDRITGELLTDQQVLEKAEKIVDQQMAREQAERDWRQKPNDDHERVAEERDEDRSR